MSECWKPADHRYDGTCNNTRLVSAHYPTMPDYIQVYDTAVRNSGWTRRQKKLWRSARDKGLTRWTYPFQVQEAGLTRDDYPAAGITLDWYVPSLTVPDVSVGGFGLFPVDEPWAADYDELSWVQAKGFAVITATEVNNAFASRVVGRLAGVICHEVGHALGFGHGGTGIMRSALSAPYYPNEEDLAALVDYYGRA